MDVEHTVPSVVSYRACIFNTNEGQEKTNIQTNQKQSNLIV